MDPRLQTLAAQVERDPENSLFRFSYAQALFREGNYEEAIPHLEFCAGAREDWMAPRILLGKAHIARDDREAARPWLEAALDLAVRQDHRDPAEECRSLLEDIED